MIKNLVLFGLLVLAALAFVGCNDDNGGGIEQPNSVLLRPDRFPSLYEGLVYEGWFVKLDEDSVWVESKSFGKFFWDEFNYRFLTPDETKGIRDSVFTIQGLNVYDWDMIAITLEQYPVDNSPLPSATVVAQSSIIRDITTFMRFPVNFDGIPTGTFAIATFSDGYWKQLGETTPASERFGLWFLHLYPGPSTAEWQERYGVGVTLPVLPDTGYSYEGWVALEGGDTVSTGKFFFPDYVDYDNSHCELRAIPNFPGEDFLLNRPENVPAERWPLDIARGGVAFITVEPSPDNDLLRPSNLVVLRGNLPKRTSPYNDIRRTNFPIGSVAGVTFPKVEAVFKTRSTSVN